jgi:hypothetical protein
VKGRMDARLGNLVIEFETDIMSERKINEATSQLRKYTSILWNNEGTTPYLCVATDGLDFLIFRPRTQKTCNFVPEDIDLEKVDSFDLRKETAGTIYKSLDRYMLYQALAPPTTESIVDTFGSKSVTLKDCIFALKRAWTVIKDEASIIYQEWAKYRIRR